MLLLLSAVFLAVFIANRLLRRRWSLPLPPGPFKVPFIGNAWAMPKTLPWEMYHTWAKEYDSEILHLDILGLSIVVLDNYELAIELLERRGALYSSRPRFTMIMEVLRFDWSFALMPYGSDRWRAHRKLMHSTFNEQTSKQFRTQQSDANSKFLRRLLDTPKNFDAHIRLLIAQVVMSVTYGLEVNSADDKYLALVERGMDWFNAAALPGTFLVDLVPSLQHVPSWLPGAHFKRLAKVWSKDIMDMIEIPLADAKAHFNESNTKFKPSFLSTQLQEPDADSPEAQELTRNVAGVIFATSADTTVSAMRSFFLAMTTNAASQLKAQAELDRVLGPGQLPTFEDEENLPYVSAILKETLRMYPVTPLSGAHAIDVEDEYKGYRIPAGSMILANVWAMMHDEEVYPDPFAWRPERFLREDGQLDPTVRDPGLIAFGFGRRICPGRFFAYSSLWLTVASVLAAFNISKVPDESGEEVELHVEFTTAPISAAKPFVCKITPRSTEAERTILSLEA